MGSSPSFQATLVDNHGTPAVSVETAGLKRTVESRGNALNHVVLPQRNHQKTQVISIELLGSYTLYVWSVRNAEQGIVINMETYTRGNGRPHTTLEQDAT